NIEVTHRCRFMGLKALYNGVVHFTNVRVPRENILLAEGKGLRVAFTTLNTGRLTLPAACVGLSKRCLGIARKWACERVQWGAPIGKHGAIAEKLARIAAEIFAMESMVLFSASIVDRDKDADVRLEAALSKLWATERTWEIANDTMQIRGGRGYETAQSLKARGARFTFENRRANVELAAVCVRAAQISGPCSRILGALVSAPMAATLCR